MIVLMRVMMSSCSGTGWTVVRRGSSEEGHSVVDSSVEGHSSEHECHLVVDSEERATWWWTVRRGPPGGGQ